MRRGRTIGGTMMMRVTSQGDDDGDGRVPVYRMLSFNNGPLSSPIPCVLVTVS